MVFPTPLQARALRIQNYLDKKEYIQQRIKRIKRIIIDKFKFG